MFRIGVVGGGRMGQTHMRAVKDSRVVEVVAVAEPWAANAARLEQAGVVVYPAALDMISDASLDGVIIAAPSGGHLDLVTEIAAAGVPMLCEKPLGLSADDARAAATVARHHGVLLQVGYWRRFVPALQEMRNRILDDSLGPILTLACAQWDEQPPASQFRSGSGGIFLDMGVHEIDQLLWLTGQQVESVTVANLAQGSDPEAPGDVDSAEALLVLTGGTIACISLGRYFPDGDLVRVEAFGVKGHQHINVLDPGTGDEPQMEALRLQAEAFAVNSLGGSAGGATGEDAAVALEIAQQLTSAAGLAVLGKR